MQSTWKTFDSLADAQRGVRGRTRAALDLIGEQLFVGETVRLACTAELHQGLSWNDGMVVLTDQRLLLSGCSEHGMTLAYYIELSRALEFRELQSTGPLARFRIPALSTIQGIAMQRAALQRLEQQIDEILGARDHSPPGGDAPAHVLEPIELLKQLAALHAAGVLTTTEFETKKAEILRRT